MMTSDHQRSVFARIREALRRPAPHRHAHHQPDTLGVPATENFRAWLPLVGPSLKERIALFSQNAAMLKADFREVDSEEEAVRQLQLLARDEGWKQLASHRDSLAAQVAGKIPLPCLLTDPGYSAAELERCDAGLTGCEALIAQTGSVMVSAPSAGGRALSVLPPHHVVIARRSQIVPDLAAAYQLVRERYAPNWPSFMSMITGPSRTGDIERILVLGAHGPKKLTIFLVP